MQYQNQGDNNESGSQDYSGDSCWIRKPWEDGRPEECSFNAPRGIAVHGPSHSCFGADLNNYVIRMVSFINND